MADQDTSTPNEEEAIRLMDLLYGEVDDAAAARTALNEEERVQLDSFAELRTLLAQVEDQEPPARLSAQLIAAAAAEHGPRSKVADERGTVGSFFASLVRPILMHPGFAAAASLVVVAGVAGALYIGGEHEMAEPTLGRSQAKEAPAAAAPSEVVSGEPAAGAFDEDRAGASGGSPPKGSVGSASASDKPLELDEMSQGFTGGSRADLGGKAPARVKDKAAENKPETTTVKKRRSPKPKSAKRRARTKTSGEGRWGATSDRKQEKSLPAPPPADRAPDQAKAPAPAKPTTELLSLRRQAVSLAKKGDCTKALAIVAKIRKQNREYCDSNVVTEPAIRACREKQPASY